MTASSFRSLHQGATPLVLPNAWDAGSARLIESLGAAAIATTSAGVCWARGHADGGAMPPQALLDATREIARVVRVPLTVDAEAGYADDPAAVARFIAQLIDAGAVGINIEDGAGAPELLCRKIEAIRVMAAKAGVDLYVNARTDVYLRGIAQGNAAVAEVNRRGALYRSAGCDGLFVPGLTNAQAMAAIAAANPELPLNVMLVPGLPPLNELHGHGVRRLSAGSALAQAALGHVSRMVQGLLAGSTDAVTASPSVNYGDMNRLLAPR